MCTTTTPTHVGGKEGGWRLGQNYNGASPLPPLLFFQPNRGNAAEEKQTRLPVGQSDCAPEAPLMQHLKQRCKRSDTRGDELQPALRLTVRRRGNG